LSDSKKSLRARWKQIPAPPASLRNALSLRICSHLAGHPKFNSAGTIGCFFPRPFEVDLIPLWTKQRDRFAFPRVLAAEKRLEFYQVLSMDQLTLGFAGLTEPDPKFCDPISLSETDLILVPGLVFDAQGGRLGSGAGFYDRYLAALPNSPSKWGVCFASQISKETLAQDETDVRMDAVCTELGFV
jgi:5-formyltetrahydrofolate cyclo-ligase